MSRQPIKVFIASPGDLARERQVFRETIDALNQGFGDGANVEFSALGWEETLSPYGRRPQSAINEEVDACDVFFLVLFRRWGQEAPDTDPYSSYTEEEFHRAVNRFHETGSPSIFALFKTVDAPSLGDPGPQLQKVLAFRRDLEESRLVLYRQFGDDDAFRREVDRHLRAYARGDLRRVTEQTERAPALATSLECSADQGVNQNIEPTTPETLPLHVARVAAEAARQGRVEAARQGFALAIVAHADPEILNPAAEFFINTGDFVLAEQILRRILAAGPVEASVIKAASHRRLSQIHLATSLPEEAEREIRDALEMAQLLNSKNEMALCFHMKAEILFSVGRLSEAEEQLRRAIEFSDEPQMITARANNYSLFGHIILTRSLNGIEEINRFAESALIEIHKLSPHNSVAQQKSRMLIGDIYQTLRSNATVQLNEAVSWLLQAIDIRKTLNDDAGAAGDYDNLGQIYKALQKYREARESWEAASNLYTSVGATNRTREVQAQLENLPPEGYVAEALGASNNR